MKMMAVGAVGNRVLRGFPSSLWARSLRPWERRRPQPRRWRSAVRSDSVGSGLRRGGVRVRLCPRTLVTAPSSDRSSRSLLLCHGSGSLSSRRPPPALRRRGPAPPPEDLPTLPPTLRRLRGVLPRPGLLHAAVPGGRSSPGGPSRQRPPSAQPRRAPRPPRPATRLPRPASCDGSHFPRTPAVGQTPRSRRRPGSRACAHALCGLRPAEPVAGPDAGARRRSEGEGR